MSKFQVNATTFIDIKFGGQDLPGQPDLFDEVCIIENATQLVPTMTFKINDAHNDLIRALHISDGMKVDVRVSEKDSDDVELSNFRVFGGDTIRNFSEGHYNDFNCILDVPKYISKAARVGLKGTTSEAMEKIASDCGLTFKGDTTNDEQVWLSAGMTYNQWARHLSTHGYISDESCMYFAVNENKELIYKDVINVLTSETPKKKLTSSLEAQKDEIIISGNRAKTSSGLLNNWVNYGYLARKDGVSGKEEIFEKVTVRKKETALAQNTEVRDQVEIARIDMLPFNCGNTYDKYEQAFYQNFRLRSTFTESLSLIVYTYTDINLLDVVEVRIGHGVGPQDRTETVKSGNYLVIAKTKIVRGGTNYGERLELIRNSTRHTGSNPLAS